MNLLRLKDDNSTNQKFNERALVFVALMLACFGLSQTAQAVTPAPDGGYPDFNTAEGDDALFSLTTGVGNAAIGTEALFSNTTGTFNTATGVGALLNNTTASNNTATGAGALFSNTTIGVNSGHDNTADGIAALLSNTTGANNTAVGSQALFSNTTAPGNTAIGFQALLDITGFGANNTAIGSNALMHTTQTANIGLGHNAGSALITGVNNIYIGNDGVAVEYNTIRIGTAANQTATYIAGISGESAVGGDAVFVTSTGKLGTITAISSERFKDEIKPMDNTSEAILALKPVTFRYKKELDPKGIPQFGLVAEEVEKVNPDLVKRDRDGNLQTVRYEAVNAMLLNEFLKEHQKVEEQRWKAQEQEAAIVQLKQDFQSKFAEQQKQIKALTSGLEKVNNQLELSKPGPQVVVSDQ